MGSATAASPGFDAHRVQQAAIPVENAPSLYSRTEADVSYVYNLKYTAINEETYDQLSSASQFYRVGKDPVVNAWRNGLLGDRESGPQLSVGLQQA